jgi:hypothetical protein
MALITGAFPFGHFPGGAFPDRHWPLPPTPAEGEIDLSYLIDRIRQITARNNEVDLTDAEITSYIYDALREITKRTLCLKDSEFGSLFADNETIALPADMIPKNEAIDALYVDGELLNQITKEESQYKIRHDGQWKHLFRGYCYYDDEIHIVPTHNQVRDYYLYFSKYHPSFGDVLLNDDFKIAIIFYCCWKIYADYERQDKAKINDNKFEDELGKYVPDELGVALCPSLPLRL